MNNARDKTWEAVSGVGRNLDVRSIVMCKSKTPQSWMVAWPPRHNASGKKDKKRLVCKKLRFVKTNKQRQRQGEVSCSCRSDNKHTIWRFIFQFNAHCDNFSPDLLLVTPLHSTYSIFSHQPPIHISVLFSVYSLSLFKYFWNNVVFYFTHLIHNLDVKTSAIRA